VLKLRRRIDKLVRFAHKWDDGTLEYWDDGLEGVFFINKL